MYSSVADEIQHALREDLNDKRSACRRTYRDESPCTQSLLRRNTRLVKCIAHRTLTHCITGARYDHADNAEKLPKIWFTGAETMTLLEEFTSKSMTRMREIEPHFLRRAFMLLLPSQQRAVTISA